MSHTPVSLALKYPANFIMLCKSLMTFNSSHDKFDPAFKRECLRIYRSGKNFNDACMLRRLSAQESQLIQLGGLLSKYLVLGFSNSLVEDMCIKNDLTTDIVSLALKYPANFIMLCKSLMTFNSSHP